MEREYGNNEIPEKLYFSCVPAKVRQATPKSTLKKLDFSST